MITQHAPLAPSSAPQWGFCSGSVAANLQAPDVPNQRTREGTASHWVGADALELWKSHGDKSGVSCAVFEGDKAPNGVVIDAEIAEGAQAWVDDVIATRAAFDRVDCLLIERRVDMPHIHRDNWGTLDTAMLVSSARTLFLWDYKYGHREVAARGNLQLVNYVAGLAREFNLPPDTRIVMRIVQPFCYHADAPIREWIVTLAELTPYFEQLRTMAAQAMTTPLMSAGVHCRDCAAIARCPTARRACYSVIDYANEAYNIETLTGPDLAAERRVLSDGLIVLAARKDAIEDDLHNRIRKGDKTAGFTLEAKQGRMSWAVPVPQVVALAKQFGADVAKPDALTPLQAIKKVPLPNRAAFESMLPSITNRPANGLKIVPLQDSRIAHAFKKE